MRREARAIRGDRRVFLCGTGEAAGRAVKARFTRGETDLVILAGVCGGLDPSLAPGTLILCREVLMEGEDPLAPDPTIAERVRKQLHAHNASFVASRLLTVEMPAGSAAEKTDLWNVYGAAGVDMETYQVARACNDANVPWIAIRAVLDRASRSLPAAVRAWRDEGDEGGIRSAALRRPQDWPRYAALALDLRKATNSLRQTLPGLVESL
jgi:nucleoside phosphorylase